MKIAILTEAYPTDEQPAARAFIHARARLYHQTGHEVRVFVEAMQGREEYCLDGVSVVRNEPDRLEQSIRDMHPDVIAFHTPYAGTPIFQLASKLIGAYPLVTWIHGYEAMYTAFQGYHTGWRRAASIPWDARKLLGLRRFLHACSGVVYVSQWLKTLAERNMRYHHSNSYVVHNPVDTELFAPVSKEEDANDELEHTSLRGIALRSLRRIYGLDIAIEAFAAPMSADLTIVGVGPLEEQLRAQIVCTGSRTTLLAEAVPHAQVPALLNRYDYFVSPSRNETQGLAMCEAMACGLPVVASRVGGIPEFVRDGIDGYLVEPEDPDALCAAIENLVSDSAKMREMGRNARQRIVDICDGQMIAAQELAILAAAADQSVDFR